MFLKHREMESLCAIAKERSLALIIDEVFFRPPSGGCDYGLATNEMVKPEGVLSFTLNGISKMIGLPQMKLGWILVDGPAQLRNEACERSKFYAIRFFR